MQLRPHSYLFHSSEYDENGLIRFKGNITKEDIGFIAQEAYEIIPELVNKPRNEETTLWNMNYPKMTPVIVKGMQELASENDDLREELAEQKALMVKMMESLEALEKN